ncbi:MAG: type II toxin-antitoxin system RelE/ParE family toxin [Nitrospinaceae bacterium]
MIKSFKDKKTENLFKRVFVRKFSGIERQAIKKLERLDAAPDLETVANLPGNRFKTLQGNRKGQYSIRINKQWRICFKWDAGATQVEITDYH